MSQYVRTTSTKLTDLRYLVHNRSIIIGFEVNISNVLKKNGFNQYLFNYTLDMISQK